MESADNTFGIFVKVKDYSEDRFNLASDQSGVAYEDMSSDGGFATIWMAKAATEVQ